MIQVDKAIISPIETVEELHRVAALWLDMTKELLPNSTPRVDWWLSIAKNLLETGTYCIMAYRNDEKKIVGFLDFIIFPEPSSGKLHGVAQHLYFMPEYRDKRRMAWNLVKWSIGMAVNKGCENLDIYADLDTMSRWTKKGFKPVQALLRRSL